MLVISFPFRSSIPASKLPYAVTGKQRIYLAILGKIQSKRFCVLFKSQRVHGVQQVVAVDGLALFLLALIARPSFTQAKPRDAYSLVMNAINSDTHSCTHSFASFDTFAVGGMDRFIIRLIFAIGR